MKTVLKFAIAGIAGLVMTAQAAATDLYDVVDPVPQFVQSDFDWAGAYVGVQKGWWISDSLFAFHGVAGVNFVPADQFLFGAEVTAGIITDFSDLDFDGNIRGRIGFVLSERALIYKVGEVGIVGGTTYWGLGGGLEFAVGDNSSLRGEVKGVGVLGGPLSELVVSAAWLWHLN